MPGAAAGEMAASSPEIGGVSVSAIEFGIVGAGWRAEFYLRIARALPERFRVAGVVVRNDEKRAAFGRTWGIPVFAALDEMLAKSSPSFVVTSVHWAANPVYLNDLADRGVPTLSETPPAPDIEGLIAVNRLTEKGARIQVAEQYSFQPHHAATLSLIAKGVLGRPTQAQVSCAHGYHGISLIRRFLGLRFEPPKIRARRFASPIVAGPDRHGALAEERVTDSVQDLAWLDWGDRLGVFDFTSDQYFSWIRNPRLLVRGERGEIVSDRVCYLQDFRAPIELHFLRRAAGEQGNLEGVFFKGLQIGEEWVYRNPFAPAALSDDEIAIATALAKMDEYVRTGRDFYALAEASQDHYLNLLVAQAIQEEREVQAESMPWAQ